MDRTLAGPRGDDCEEWHEVHDASSRSRWAGAGGSSHVAARIEVPVPRSAARSNADARRTCQLDVTRTTSSTPSRRARRATATSVPERRASPAVDDPCASRRTSTRAPSGRPRVSRARPRAQPVKRTTSSARTSRSARARRAAHTGCSPVVRPSEKPRTATRRVLISAGTSARRRTRAGCRRPSARDGRPCSRGASTRRSRARACEPGPRPRRVPRRGGGAATRPLARRS